MAWLATPGPGTGGHSGAPRAGSWPGHVQRDAHSGLCLVEPNDVAACDPWRWPAPGVNVGFGVFENNLSSAQHRPALSPPAHGPGRLTRAWPARHRGITKPPSGGLSSVWYIFERLSVKDKDSCLHFDEIMCLHLCVWGLHAPVDVCASACMESVFTCHRLQGFVKPAVNW